MNLEERFHNAIDWIYERSYFLGEQVSKLGYPEMVTGFPSTAGVSWNPERKRVRFMFNTKFYEQITDEEFYFIVAHEATHIINGHVFFLKTECDRHRDDDLMDAWPVFSNKFGLAADCVVNDSLTFLYGMPRIELPPDSDGRIVYGQEIVGTDCHELSVLDVMRILPEESEGGEGHDLWDSFFDGEGLRQDFIDSITDFIEQNETNGALGNQDAKDLDSLKDTMSDCSDSAVRRAGKALNSGRERIQALNSKINWSRILQAKTSHNQMEDVWNRPNRKLGTLYPKVLLPKSQERETEDIFIAIDVSSSIDVKALELFASVVRNTPKHFKLKAITFNTKCEPFDLESDTIKRGGGTAFDIIENYIQDNLKKYPKAVFVLTDGEGSPVRPQYPRRWTWLLYGRASTEFCRNMSNYEIKGLLI